MPSGKKSRRRVGENSAKKSSSKKVRRAENTGYEANTEEPPADSQQSSRPPGSLATILAEQRFSNAAKSLRNVTRSGRGDPRLQRILQLTAAAHPLSGKTELMYAAFKGDIPKLRALIETGGQVDAVDSQGRTALAWAVEGDHAQAIHVLCQNGATVDKLINEGVTTLFMACASGKIHSIKALCEEGANTSFNHLEGIGIVSCLAAASYSHDHPDSLKILIKYGAAINSVDSQMTALSMACKMGRIKSVKFLLKEGALVNVQESQFAPLISMAFAVKDKIKNISPTYAADVDEIIGILVNQGADVNAKYTTPDTTLNYSALTNAASTNIDVCRALLHYGADPNIKIRYALFVPGMTDMPPLKLTRDVDTCSLLLKHGADPHSPTSDTGTTVLMWYIGLNRPLDMIKEVCRRLTPEQLNAQSRMFNTYWTYKAYIGGFNALHYACLYDDARPDLIELLGKAGIDVNARHFFERDGFNREADTPLMMVCRETVLGTEMPVYNVIKCKDRLKKVEALLRIGANTEVQDANRMTPLMIACQGVTWDTLPIVEALCSKPRVSNLVRRETARPTTLRRGIANLEVRSISGRTAFMIAILTGTLEVAEYLAKRGADVQAVDNSGKNALDICIEYKNEDGPGVLVYLDEIRFLRGLGVTSTVVLSQENEDLL